MSHKVNEQITYANEISVSYNCEFPSSQCIEVQSRLSVAGLAEAKHEKYLAKAEIARNVVKKQSKKGSIR
ncbi:MAG: hypothetical protein JW800_00135 [Candidatus Omnitrophica bacterium]|nr:hypothetical protein [Candidatus Omnitrophota bacterium]